MYNSEEKESPIFADMKDKFAFFNIDTEYADFLRKYEEKIPNLVYKNRDKFVCGIIFEVNNQDYFVPVSSFKEQQKTNILIKSNKGIPVASLRFSFMFPVPKEMRCIKDFSKEEYSYQRLVQEELNFCNNIRAKIIEKAQSIYNEVVIKQNPTFAKFCCAFPLLEQKCIEYCKAHNFELPQSLPFPEVTAYSTALHTTEKESPYKLPEGRKR